MASTIEDAERVTWESAKAWLDRAETDRALASLEEEERIASTQQAVVQSTAERLLASFFRQAELRAKMGLK